MENHSLETEEGMHCSWCGKLLPFCECPAKLARSLDKERADAIRERNELREQLLAARREVEAARAALNGIADHGWCYDGRVTFTINCVGMGDAKRLEALLTAALAATQETQSRFPSTDPLPDEDW